MSIAHSEVGSRPKIWRFNIYLVVTGRQRCSFWVELKAPGWMPGHLPWGHWLERNFWSRRLFSPCWKQIQLQSFHLRIFLGGESACEKKIQVSYLGDTDCLLARKIRKLIFLCFYQFLLILLLFLLCQGYTISFYSLIAIHSYHTFLFLSIEESIPHARTRTHTHTHTHSWT